MTDLDRGTQAPPFSELARFFAALSVQARVIGALLMRELHTRYGRENIGYLWLIGEPLMLGSVIAILHSGNQAHDDLDPVGLSVVGYSIFITFRGIVNRSEGSMPANVPLLYHRMVTVFDVTIARGLLELAGTLSAFFVLMFLAIALGYMSLPARPLYLALGILYVFWISMALGWLITGGTYERPLFERLVHPFTYFMMPLSGAFFRVEWLPPSFRKAILWVPLSHIFETIRYGQFTSATLEYVDFDYVNKWCLILTFFGLLSMRTLPNRVQLS